MLNQNPSINVVGDFVRRIFSQENFEVSGYLGGVNPIYVFGESAKDVNLIIYYDGVSANSRGVSANLALSPNGDGREKLRGKESEVVRTIRQEFSGLGEIDVITSNDERDLPSYLQGFLAGGGVGLSIQAIIWASRQQPRCGA